MKMVEASRDKSDQLNSSNPLTGIVAPHQHDVLSGRGVTTNRHKGNENFRELVDENKAVYVTSTKRQKMSISRSIVNHVRNLDPPGRFLEKNPDDGLWYDIGDKKACEKTAQALRDRAANARKQQSEDFALSDLINVVFDETNSQSTDTGAMPNFTNKLEPFDQLDFKSDRMCTPLLMSHNKPKTTFDKGITGWGNFHEEPLPCGTSRPVKKHHRRCISTPDTYGKSVWESEVQKTSHRTALTPDDLFNEDTFLEMSLPELMTNDKPHMMKKKHRRANSTPISAHALQLQIEPIQEQSPLTTTTEFEPIPFSEHSQVHHKEHERRLSEDVSSPEFLDAIFGNNEHLPPPATSKPKRGHRHNRSMPVSFGSHSINNTTETTFTGVDKETSPTNGNFDSNLWRRKGNERRGHRTSASFDLSILDKPFRPLKENTSNHRKRLSGDFSLDFDFQSKIFGGPLDNLSKNQSNNMVPTLANPPTKKYRPVDLHDLSFMNPSPTPSDSQTELNHTGDLTRAQFSSIAQGDYYHNGSFSTGANNILPNQQIYSNNNGSNGKEQGKEYSDQFKPENPPATVIDEDGDHKMFLYNENYNENKEVECDRSTSILINSFVANV